MLGAGGGKVRMKPLEAAEDTSNDFDQAKTVFQGALCAGRADRFSAGPGARGPAPHQTPRLSLPKFRGGRG